MCFCKVHQEIADLLHIAGAVRDLRDLFKVYFQYKYLSFFCQGNNPKHSQNAVCMALNSYA